MATTYGYGGEFSSDEDVDKLEQIHSERMVQSKFDSNPRPSKKQIEDLIEAIRKMPIDQEVNLADDMLAGLLDYFKTQRGPIVESTRKLYHKIALRLIRGDQQSQVIETNNAAPKDTNGNMNSNNSVIQDNNNSINLVPKGPLQKADTFSSDEDEEVSFLQRRVVQQNDIDKMDVDSVTPTGPPRITKQVDMSTTDEDDNASESSDEDTSELEELNSESDVMDVTPIKPPADQQKANREKEGVEAVLAASRVTPRQPEYSAKRQPLAQSTPKDGPETSKKPYTRSQRVATRSATRGKVAKESSSKSLTQSNISGDAFIKKKQGSSKKYVFLAASFLVVVLAFLLYYFRSSISKSAAPFLAPKIQF